MADKPKVEFIGNPNPLRKKVRVEHGLDPQLMIERADQRVAELSDEFESIFAGNIVELAAAMSRVRAADNDNQDRDGPLMEVRHLLNELRGQAGTFGYPLVSQVGDSACKFIDLSEDFGVAEIEVVEMHVNALKAVSQSKIKGDGGPIGAELMAGLREVITKYNDKTGGV